MKKGLLMIRMLGVVVAALLLAGCPQPPSDGGGFERGKKAPDFTLTDLDGKTVSLAGLSGKVVMLDFWTPFLEDNLEVFPEIAYSMMRFKSIGFQAVSISPPGSEAAVRQAIQGKGYDWIFAVDTQGRVASLYEISRYPTSIFLNSSGVFASKHNGGIGSRRNIETAVEDAIRSRL
jgi:peroxiredoxin